MSERERKRERETAYGCFIVVRRLHSMDCGGLMLLLCFPLTLPTVPPPPTNVVLQHGMGCRLLAAPLGGVKQKKVERTTVGVRSEEGVATNTSEERSAQKRKKRKAINTKRQT